MRVLWIDPGESVGWATAEVTGITGIAAAGRGLVTSPRLEVLDYGILKLKRFALMLLDGAAKYDVIGYESYNIRPDLLHLHAGSDVPTLQLVGMIRLAVWAAQRDNGRANDLLKLVTQPPLKLSLGRGAARLYFNDHIQAVVADAEEGPHDQGHHGSALLHLAAWYHETYGQGNA